VGMDEMRLIKDLGVDYAALASTSEYFVNF
jgi:hypothetical protein